MVDIDTRPLRLLHDVLDADAYERFYKAMHAAAMRLDGRTVWNVNSTAEGGGVAEMLSTLLPYARDAGWDVRWAVMSGDEEFFDVTKGIHNALHGAPPSDEIWERASDVYSRVTDANAAELARLVHSGDLLLIHDPQTAGLIAPLAHSGAAASWQCHVGTDDANECTRRAWDFLTPYVEAADRYVFTRADYLWEGLDPDRLRVIPPSIDALSVKNGPLDDQAVQAILRAAGVIDGREGAAEFVRPDGVVSFVNRPVSRIGGDARLPDDARIVLQVSRWDRLKDPIGFLRMFAGRLVERPGVHLVYAGPSTSGVNDDPEGKAVFESAAEVWRSFEPSTQERVHLLEVPMEDVEENAAIINALQRRADVVVQKSLEEGFGLTVAEAMWKGRPVVAGRVGGIQDQIEHNKSGILIDDPYDVAAFADAVCLLLDDPDKAQRFGSQAHRRVKEHFLGPRQLTQYADLMVELARADRAA
jgi:trehalose synthase